MRAANWAFASSEASSAIDTVQAGQYSARALAARTAISAIVGGTVSQLSGGDFADGAVAAAMQRLYNDEQHKPAKADQVAYGEFRSYAIGEDGSIPNGLADAKASAAAACERNGGGCSYVDGSHGIGLDKKAWDNIVAATGGVDKSGGGNYMCVNTTACTVVTKAYTYKNGHKILVTRLNPLTPSGTVTIFNTRAGTLTLYFYRDPYRGWLTKQDFNRSNGYSQP